MVIMKRNNDQIEYDITPLENVAKLVKTVPSEYINEEQNNINDKFLEYALPLIQGEVQLIFEKGLPKVYRLKNN